MAGVIRSLVAKIQFVADTLGLRKLETHTTEAKRQMRAASRAAWQLKRDLHGLALGVQAFAAAVIGGRIAKLFTTDFSVAADESAKFARGLGISTRAYQAMTHAAGLSGVSVAELNVALPKLAQNAGNAADGSKAAALAFKRAGVEIKEGGKFKDPIRLMYDLADSFEAGRIQGNKTQVLMNLFGRSGKKMGELLKGGSKGIKAAMLEAEKLGIVLSKSEQKIAEDYNDEMLRTTSVLKGLRNQIAVRLLPKLTDALKKFVAWAKEGDNLSRTLAKVIQAAKTLAVVLATIAVVKLAKNFLTLVSALKKAAFWWQINGRAALIANAKFLLIGAAIAALVLVIQSLYVWSKGGKSAVGDLFNHFGIADKARAVVNALGAALRWIGSVAVGVGKFFWQLFMIQHRFYKAVWTEFGPSIMALGRAILALFEEVWPIVTDAFTRFKLAMVAGVEVLAQVWAAIKPALVALGAAIGELWVAVKPALVALYDAWKKVQDAVWSLIKKAMPYLGEASKGALKILIGMIIAGINAVTLIIQGITALVKVFKWLGEQVFKILGPVIKLLDSMIDKISTVLGFGGEKVSIDTALKTAGVQLPGAPGAKPTTQNNSVSVGAVSVSITGTTGMSAEDIAAAVKAGVDEGIQERVSNAINIFRPTVGVPV